MYTATGDGTSEGVALVVGVPADPPENTAGGPSNSDDLRRESKKLSIKAFNMSIAPSGQVLHGAPRAELGRIVMSRLPLFVPSRQRGSPLLDANNIAFDMSRLSRTAPGDTSGGIPGFERRSVYVTLIEIIACVWNKHSQIQQPS
jgi:hypothetical protein